MGFADPAALDFDVVGGSLFIGLVGHAAQSNEIPIANVFEIVERGRVFLVADFMEFEKSDGGFEVLIAEHFVGAAGDHFAEALKGGDG